MCELTDKEISRRFSLTCWLEEVKQNHIFVLYVIVASKHLFGVAGLLVLEAKYKFDPETACSWSEDGALLFPFSSYRHLSLYSPPE